MHPKHDENTPLALSCDKCGAPMEFDIIAQNYSCLHCGNIEFLNLRKEKIDKWCRENKKAITSKKTKLSYVACPNCGATVSSSGDSESLSCSFCSSPVLKKTFFKQEVFPRAIIPFNITEKEADEILNNWLKNNSLKKEARILKNNKIELRQIYLPYQLFTGPLTAQVKRKDDNEEQKFRAFDIETFINQKLIVACDNVQNDLLDAIEPFDKTRFKDFEFIYLSNIQAKTQDIDYNATHKDFVEESASDIAQLLEKKLRSKYILTKIDDSNINSVPVLLPIYYAKIQDVTVAINGQTGKIAVFGNKFKKKRPWLIKSAIVSILALIAIVIFGYFIDLQFNNEDIGALVGIVIFFSLLIYAIFDKTKGGLIKKKKIRETKDTYERHKNRKLQKIEGFNLKNDFADLVFMEEYENVKQAVDIKPTRFKTAIYIIATFIATPIVMLLPFLIALAIHPFVKDDGTLNAYFSFEMFKGGLLWYILAFPLAFVWLIKFIIFLSKKAFDDVMIKPYGSEKHYKLSTFKEKIARETRSKKAKKKKKKKATKATNTDFKFYLLIAGIAGITLLILAVSVFIALFGF